MKKCQVIFYLAFFKIKTIMKKFLLMPIMVVTILAQAQDYNVTFKVNTSNIEVGPNGMYVGDGPLGGSDAHAMSDDDMDDVWEVTVSLEAGTSGKYAFFNSPTSSSDWGTKENLEGKSCGDPNNFWSRILEPVNEDKTLLHCFASCFGNESGLCGSNYYDVTFLFENNICVNNGKNGINFDHSQSASAIYQNNTLYFNGVHEIIQDLSVEEGYPAHRGQKVGGIKANNVKNATVVNNIIMTRDNQFSALQLNNVSGTRVAVNNLLVNGNYAWPANEENNLINLDPMFTMAPNEVLDEIDIATTDFTLLEGSPAIDAGNPSYGPEDDYDDNPRPISTTGISSTTFEDSTGGWSSFGATIEISEDTALTGEKSLLTKDRTANWHSPRLVLSGMMTVGETYTFNVWVKLADGETGTSQITIKNTDTNEYVNVTDQVQVSDQEWTMVSGDFTYEQENNMFVYVKGPSIVNGVGAEYYIDDFSLVVQGSPPVDFNSSGNIIDIGAYEYTEETIDTTPPVITLDGDNPMTIECAADGFTDPGASATDEIDGDVAVETNLPNGFIEAIQYNIVGTYQVIYTATDSSGNSSSTTRIVNIEEDTPPSLDFAQGSSSTYDYELGWTFDIGNIEPPIVTDYCDGDNLSYNVSHNVDTSSPGTYTITFTATDSSGNTASTSVSLIVIDPLSISENYIENAYLFPNPSSENIYIKNLKGDELITMYDLLGRVVEIPFQNTENNSEIVADISLLKRGLYLVVISDVSNNSKRTISVIKD